jgi:hypothetical protein
MYLPPGSHYADADRVEAPQVAVVRPRWWEDPVPPREAWSRAAGGDARRARREQGSRGPSPARGGDDGLSSPPVGPGGHR